MAHYLVPHTDEWFEKLDQFNPMQAAVTRQVIQLAGRTEVCSVCGDAPALDYKLLGELPAQAVRTLRLCDDCLKIRQATEGERFEPMTAH